MSRSCPSCSRSFGDDDGFCPYDGTRLQIVGADLTAAILDGRYVLDRKLGEGGMGTVYAGHHAVIERKVAVKVLKASFARDLAQASRFVQEARAASKIGHPNVVEVFDFGNAPDGSPYFVMEFLEGETLGQLMAREGPLPAARAAMLLAQLLRALGAAHNKGVVHRDLKPDNIFIANRDGRPDFVKIVDFGIALVQTADVRLTKVGAIFGTPDYMAPEQAAGTGADRRTDIFALGVILHEMLTGIRPFHRDNPLATMGAVMMERAIPPSEARPELQVPAVLEAVILRALEKEPAARYDSCGDMLAALEEAAAGIPTLAPGALDEMQGSGLLRLPAPPSAPSVAVAESVPRSAPAPATPSRRARGRTGTGVAIAALVAVVGLVGAIVATSRGGGARRNAATPAPESRPAVAAVPIVIPDAGVARAARVHLTSSPSGAEVSEDGKTLGVTPLDLTPPPAGQIRHLRLALAGRVTQTVDLPAGTSGEVLVTLPAVPVTARVPGRPAPGPPAPPAPVRTALPGNPQATDLQNPFQR